MVAHCPSGVSVWRRVPALARQRRCTVRHLLQGKGAEPYRQHRHAPCWYARPENALTTRPPNTPFFALSRPLPCACGATVGLNVAAVQGGSIPVDIAPGVGMGLKSLQDTPPSTVTLPSRKAVPAGLPGSIALGNVSPGRSSLESPHNPIDDLAMIPKVMTALRICR